MKGSRRHGYVRNTLALAFFSILLNGCFMEDEELNGEDDVAEPNQVSGSVGDGPIINASIRIQRNDGAELEQFKSDGTAGYNIVVRAKGKYYPLSIHASGGTDLVTNAAPDFDLLGAVFEPGKKSIANVNPFSTVAVELAGDLPGGADKVNLETAENIVSSAMDFGLTSLAASGTMRTRIDSSNVAEVVRGSEALGETVRRTRDALAGTGFPTNGNDVVRAISSDLTDSVVDGFGGPGADARIAAVWNIASAQVLLETMANELHVNGGDATQLMNNAIDVVSTGSPNPSLADLTATPEMVARARIGLVAAHAVTSDPSIADLLSATDGIHVGAVSSTIRNTALPGDYRSRLNNAVVLAAGGNSDLSETVNNISRNRIQVIVSENQAPTISGTPASTVTEGNTYSFTPSVFDVDSGELVFSVENLPSWASFDSTTGRITGTPQSSDVGVYAGISITVSDEQASSILGPFEITVQAASLGSVTLSWVEPTQNEDGSPLTDLAGYKIYWGTTPGSYPNSVTIDDKNATTYVVDNLAFGTYEFVATSFNASGVESGYSAPAIKVVQ